MTFLQLNQKEKYEKNRGLFPPYFLIYKKFINLAIKDRQKATYTP